MRRRTFLSRSLSMLVAMAFFLSLSPAAFAEETVSEQIMVETQAGSYEQVNVTVSIDSVQNADGSTTSYTNTQTECFITENEQVVNYNGSSETATNLDGELIKSYEESHYKVSNMAWTQGAEGGSETTKQQAAPDVNVGIPLDNKDDPETETAENQNSQSSANQAGAVIEISGDVKENDEDGEYDYSTTVVEKTGSVTVGTTDLSISESPNPEYSDMDYFSSETAPDGSNDIIKEIPSQAPEEYLPGAEGEPTAPEETVDGYEFVYMGSGNTSQFRPAVIFTEPLTPEAKLELYGDDIRNGAYIHSTYYTNSFVNWLNEDYRSTVAKTPDGKYVCDEEGFILDIYGNRVLKEEKVVKGPDGETYYLHRFDAMGSNLNVEGWYQDGEWIKELNGKDKYGVVYSTAQQFVLVDQNTGEVVTTYCADISTPTENGFGYIVQNLEDAGYYTPEQAAQIRSIAKNGYWGTQGYEADEKGIMLLDGDGNPVPKAGSLEAMKAAMLDSGQFTEEELEALTDGVALTATQMAIWSYSNHMQGVQFVNTHYVGQVGIKEVNKGGSNYMGNVPVDKEAEAKLLFKVYDYLRNLDPTSYEGNETTANTIINEKNFLKNMSLTVLEKAEDHANNLDMDSSNDAYITNLNFALVVSPSTENGDDLVVSVLDENNNLIAKGRIAGEAQEGETVLQPDANGNYSFTGITLVEGKQNFNITLEGVQNLKEGVYLYRSEVKTDEGGDDVTSQTMVGMASGNRSVNVSMNIEFDMSVEDDIIVTEHVWREEWTKPAGGDPPPAIDEEPPSDEPEEPDKTPPEDPEDPKEDEEVLLADPPKTGGYSKLYGSLAALSCLGIIFLQLMKKRKAPEAELQPEAQEEPAAQDDSEKENTGQEESPAATEEGAESSGGGTEASDGDAVPEPGGIPDGKAGEESLS